MFTTPKATSRTSSGRDTMEDTGDSTIAAEVRMTSQSGVPTELPQARHTTLLKLSHEEMEAVSSATDLWVSIVEKYVVPPLDFKEYKGRYGKICVVGGSMEFTGAPYFAATAALRMGADLVTLITTPSASQPIKSYSPELMVYPLLPEWIPTTTGAERESASGVHVELTRLRVYAEPLLRKADVVILGPGLGCSSSLRLRMDDESMNDSACSAQEKTSHQSACKPKPKETEEHSSKTKIAILLKGAMQEAQKAVVGPGPPKTDEHRNSDSSSNPLEVDAAACRSVVKEADAAAAVTQRAALLLLHMAMRMRKQLVIDADLIRILCLPCHEEFLGRFKEYSAAVFTPNAFEMELLLRVLSKRQKALNIPGHAPLQEHGLLPNSLRCEAVSRVAEAVAILGGPSILAKGRLDVLGVYLGQTKSGAEAEVCVGVCGLDRRFLGIPKRSGGQGDILCGVVAEHLVWMERAKATGQLKAAEEEARHCIPQANYGGTQATNLILLHAAAAVAREAASCAFRQYGRAISATDIIQKINSAAAIIFPSAWLSQASQPSQ